MGESQSRLGVEDPPLTGIRVLDLTRVLSGPFCTLLLADLGADVVKIERPDRGDDARGIGPFLRSGASSYFASLNRGKQSVALDLKKHSDQEKFLRLVEKADVLVENFRPTVMDTLGLGAARLRSLNPRLVYASISGFGKTGARSSRAAYDIIIQALSGLMSITGSGGGPVRVGISISDLTSGLFAAFGILAALRDRDRTGAGCTLDLAMLDCSVALMENAISRLSVTGEVPRPLGTQHPSITPFQSFATADGALVVAAVTDAMWRKLCALLGCHDLIDDPRFGDNPSRTAHRDELVPILARRFAGQTTRVWLDQLEQADVPAAPVRDLAGVLADSDLAARSMIHEMESEGETFLTAGSPLRFNGRPPDLSARAPNLGEHAEAVFRSWLVE